MGIATALTIVTTTLLVGIPLLFNAIEQSLIVALSVLAARLAVDKHSNLYQLIQATEALSFLSFDDNSDDDRRETSD